MCVASELIIIIENTKDHGSVTSLNTALNQTNNTHETNHTNKSQSNNALEIILLVLKYFGLTILGIFLIEIVIKLAFNTRAFLKSKLELFDSVIVIVSFVLDIVFFDHHAHAAFELITLLRLWRIARIVNGI